MEIIYLGYSIYNFTTKEGEKIDGLKIFFAYQNDKPNSSGYVCGNYFVDRQNDNILFNIVQKCIPLEKYVLDLIPSFGGKTRIKSINTVK